MNNLTKIFILFGILTLPGITLAGPPNGYGYYDWSVSGGDITATCPPGASSCQVVSQSLGFLQWKVFPTAGATTYYIQTITTDPNATGDFVGGGEPTGYGVSYIQVAESLPGQPAAVNENGIAGIQNVNDTTAASNFTSNATVETGWAAAAGADNIIMNQHLDENLGVSGEAFTTDFSFASTNNPDTGAIIDYQLDISQTVDLFVTGGDTTDRQVFALQKTNRTTGDSVTLAGAAGDETVTWGAGAEVRATWIGQQITVAGAGAMVTDIIFGYTGVENLDNSTSASETMRSAPVIPTDWPNDVGFTAPTF